MNVYSEFATLMGRLAVLPNILRTRHEDVSRLERHGAADAEIEARVAAVLPLMRKAVNELEKALV